MSAATTNAPDLILHHGRFTTLDKGNPQASAVAIRDGIFTVVGSDADILPLADNATQVIDLNCTACCRVSSTTIFISFAAA